MQETAHDGGNGFKRFLAGSGCHLNRIPSFHRLAAGRGAFDGLWARELASLWPRLELCLSLCCGRRAVGPSARPRHPATATQLRHPLIFTCTPGRRCRHDGEPAVCLLEQSAVDCT